MADPQHDDDDRWVDKYLSMPCVAEEFDYDDIVELQEYLTDDEFEPEVALPEPDYSCHVLFDGLPNADKYKKPKRLAKFVTKFLAQIGASLRDIEVCTNEAGEAQGAVIAEFSTPEMASEAMKNPQIQGREFMGRTFHLNLLSDVDRYAEMDEGFVAPDVKKFVTQNNLYSWMSDRGCRDQYVIRYDRETEIYWAETKNPPVLAYGGEREKKSGKVWVQENVVWSPNGTYMCTFHKRGIALWGGPDFQKIARFPHMNVHQVRFSPDERFVATWNGDNVDVDTVNTEGALLVWEIASGRALRSLKQVQANAVPDFSWSANGKFLARLAPKYKIGVDPETHEDIRRDLLQVYSTPGMGLLGGASIEAPGVQEMQWSPTDPYLVWWAPEKGDIPACVTLTEFPSKRVVRTKNLFHVKTCRLYWQKSGDFLCVEVTRVSKSGKTEYTDFQLFRMRERNIPIEILSFTTPIIHFAWEPVGTRFGIIHQGEGPGRFQTVFYDMGKKGTQHQLLFKLEDRPVNELFWSPTGGHVVIAGMTGIQNMSGEMIEFYNVDEQRSMGTQEHYLCNHITWDPSGRIVTTAVMQEIHNPQPRFTNSNAFNLWTFQGAPIFDESKQKLHNFLWRPRPPSLLSADERQDVKTNLKKHIQKYLADDRRKANRVKYKKYNDRYQLRCEFENWLQECEGRYEAQTQHREEVYANLDKDEGVEMVEHVFNIEISRHVEEYNP